jgi:predicted metal-dependent hydrolase
MNALQDPEFGTITLRRSKLARHVRLKLDTRGGISISLPLRTPLLIARQLLNESRHHLRRMLGDIQANQRTYTNGDQIGKSHILRFEAGGEQYSHDIIDNLLIVSHPIKPNTEKLQAALQKAILAALRLQAKAYLSRRLQQFAELYDFPYSKLRFSSASTRWGSCSNQKTISLNIWLMELPFELIDYVLIHELCHTKEMNHSPRFWRLVESFCPEYKIHRKQLKQFRPHS